MDIAGHEIDVIRNGRTRREKESSLGEKEKSKRQISIQIVACCVRNHSWTNATYTCSYSLQAIDNKQQGAGEIPSGPAQDKNHMRPDIASLKFLTAEVVSVVYTVHLCGRGKQDKTPQGSIIQDTAWCYKVLRQDHGAYHEHLLAIYIHWQGRFCKTQTTTIYWYLPVDL